MNVIQKHLRRVLRPGWHKIFQDPRRKKGSWSLGEIMERALQGMLGGCRNLRSLELLSSFSGERLPDTTVWDLITKIDPAPLHAELARGVKEAARSHELDEKELPLNVVAIDGKSISVNATPVDRNSHNRSQKGCKKYVNMALRAMFISSTLKLHLGQYQLPKGCSERGALRGFVAQLIELFGRTGLLEVVSVDAGYSSGKNAQFLASRGIGYIMVLKNVAFNQMTTAAKRLFKDRKDPLLKQHEQVNGKHVTRSLYRITAPNVKRWESAKELWCVECSTCRGTKVVKEVRYFASSISPSRLSHQQVLRTVRHHWAIENNANWVLDTAWQEDRNPWSNKALELVSLLRLLAYNIIARLKFRRMRSRQSRALPWKDLLMLVQHTLFPVKNIEILATR